MSTDPSPFDGLEDQHLATGVPGHTTKSGRDRLAEESVDEGSMTAELVGPFEDDGRSTAEVGTRLYTERQEAEMHVDPRTGERVEGGLDSQTGERVERGLDPQSGERDRGCLDPLVTVDQVPLASLGDLSPADLDSRVGAAAQSWSPPGVIGPYKIIRKLGEGGMAAVYLACDTEIDLNVAIKIETLPLDRVASARFTREGDLQRRLRGVDYVVEILESGVTECGRKFHVFELADTSLESRIKNEGTLSDSEAARYGYQLAYAVEVLRLLELIHRDIKPANLLFGKDGQIKIADFGLCKRLGEDTADIDGMVTVAGQVPATPNFMSLEQVQAQELDFRSDLYSLAITLYHAMTKQLPFESGYPLALVSKSNEEPKSMRDRVPDLPSEFDAIDAILLRCMSRDMDRRYTALELMQAFKPLCGDADLVPAIEDDPVETYIGWARGSMGRMITASRDVYDSPEERDAAAHTAYILARRSLESALSFGGDDALLYSHLSTLGHRYFSLLGEMNDPRNVAACVLRDTLGFVESGLEVDPTHERLLGFRGRIVEYVGENYLPGSDILEKRLPRATTSDQKAAVYDEVRERIQLFGEAVVGLAEMHYLLCDLGYAYARAIRDDPGSFDIVEGALLEALVSSSEGSETAPNDQRLATFGRLIRAELGELYQRGCDSLCEQMLTSEGEDTDDLVEDARRYADLFSHFGAPEASEKHRLTAQVEVSYAQAKSREGDFTTAADTLLELWGATDELLARRSGDRSLLELQDEIYGHLEQTHEVWSAAAIRGIAHIARDDDFRGSKRSAMQVHFDSAERSLESQLRFSRDRASVYLTLSRLALGYARSLLQSGCSFDAVQSAIGRAVERADAGLVEHNGNDALTRWRDNIFSRVDTLYLDEANRLQSEIHGIASGGDQTTTKTRRMVAMYTRMSQSVGRTLERLSGDELLDRYCNLATRSIGFARTLRGVHGKTTHTSQQAYRDAVRFVTEGLTLNRSYEPLLGLATALGQSGFIIRMPSAPL